MWPNITRDAFLHLVGSWAFASSRKHHQKGSQKWPAEQALFLESQGESLSWYGTILDGMTEGSGQTTPATTLLPQLPVVLQTFPMAGNQGGNALCFT